LLDKERGVQARGIPQVVETPEKFMDIAKFIRGKILGKPSPEKYDHYEDFVEALIDWKLDQPSPNQTAKSKPLLDDFETYEDFIEALIDWKISQPHNLTQLTAAALNKVLGSVDPDDWRDFRQILGGWVQPVAFYVPDFDGTGVVRSWLFERTPSGVVGHREDGAASLFWSQESGILSWSGEQLPSPI